MPPLAFAGEWAHALSWLSEFYSLMDAFSSLVLTWKVGFKWDQNLVYGWLTQGRNFFRRTLSQSVKLWGVVWCFSFFSFFPWIFWAFSLTLVMWEFLLLLFCFVFSFLSPRIWLNFFQETWGWIHLAQSAQLEIYGRKQAKYLSAAKVEILVCLDKSWNADPGDSLWIYYCELAQTYLNILVIGILSHARALGGLRKASLAGGCCPTHQD